MKNKCKITDEITEICKENILAGMSYSACARAIRVTYQTWNNWQTLGREGKAPYAKWHIAIQEAEASLLKECLDQLKLSMKQGNVESTKWLLKRRFSSDGYGKQAAINVKSQNENLNLNINATATQSETDKIRASILGKLTPKGKLPELSREAWQ